MKILLVVPPSPDRKKIIRAIDCSHEAKANYLWQPNDFMIITSLLRPSDKVSFIDGTADGLSEQAFFEALKEHRADLVCFALSSVCWESDYRYFDKAGHIFPNTPVYVIGDIFLEENYRDFILQKCDGIIFNPYLPDLERMSHVRDGKQHNAMPGICTKAGQGLPDKKTGLTRVKSGVPRHELFLKRGYRFPFARRFRFSTVTTMWGCPFSCSYCSDSRIPPVARSFEDVLRELDYVDALNIRELFFADKTFGFDRKNALPLLEEMAERFHFSWSCYFHPQLYDEGLLEKMKAAGCHTMIIGIDSANTEALVQYNRKVSRQKIEGLIAHANRLGISICADLILGLGHETEADIVNTINYALSLPIDFASFNIAAPLPGSSIRRQAVASGKLVFGKEGFDTSGQAGIIGSEKISVEAIKKLRKKAFRRFYLRPSYLLRRLSKTSSFEHLLIQLLEMAAMAKKVG